MYRKLSNIDFNSFIGQKVIEVRVDKNLPLVMIFESGRLIVECPWRLHVKKEIAIGYSDCIHSPERYSHKKIEKILMEKGIVKILYFDEISDLVVEFEGDVILELFHDSN